MVWTNQIWFTNYTNKPFALEDGMSTFGCTVLLSLQPILGFYSVETFNYLTEHKKTIPSLVSQGMLGNSLVKVNKRIRGRPSVSLAPMAFKKQRIQGTPTPDIRKDRIDHFPEWEKTRQQCIYCDSLSQIKCRNCNVWPCLNKERNSSNVFHQN